MLAPHLLHFFVLVNDHSSVIFGISRGLRQGYPLSLMFFVITMEGLTMFLDYMEAGGNNKALGKQSCLVNILIFVDDMMILSKALVHYVQQIEEVIFVLSRSLGLEGNVLKSNFFQQRSPR